MKIFTSRYSNKALKDFDGVIIGASVGYPRFPLPYKLTFRPGLGPDRSFKNAPYEEYLPLYIAKLDRLGVGAIMGDLDRLSQERGDADVVILCYEDIRIEGEWCHRRMLADYITQHTGIEVEELDNPTPPKLSKPTSPARAPKSSYTRPIYQ